MENGGAAPVSKWLRRRFLIDVPESNFDSDQKTVAYSVLKVKAVALDETMDGWMAQVMAMGRAQGVLAFNLKLEAVGSVGGGWRQDYFSRLL
ncbi:hypothetical protein CCACVL1_08041 [Corchorus capsularis]|uniref:Uncharacterized protein n=1 Tax=Corchorus capsularis TaxID=210143 RepID=A0A1R3J2K8_COCAP|nr:hypothetical protein CCACVL1_08041 [Corchorus capsularis]